MIKIEEKLIFTCVIITLFFVFISESVPGLSFCVLKFNFLSD